MNQRRFFLGVLGAVALYPASAAGDVFSFAGGEQTFVVPRSVHAVDVVATGAQGGGPVTCCLAAGRRGGRFGNCARHAG